MVSVSGSKCERMYPHCTHFTTAFNRMSEWMNGMLIRIIFLLFRLHSVLPLFLVWAFLLLLPINVRNALYSFTHSLCVRCILAWRQRQTKWWLYGDDDDDNDHWWLGWRLSCKVVVFTSTAALQGMRESETETTRITMVGSWTWSHSKQCTMYDARWDAVVFVWARQTTIHSTLLKSTLSAKSKP